MGGRWLAAIRRFLIAAAVGNLIWETAQLLLYTLWRTEPVRPLVHAVLHCMAGDIVIAAVTLVIALATLGHARWPDERSVAVAALSSWPASPLRSVVNTSTPSCGDRGPIPNGCRRCHG